MLIYSHSTPEKLSPIAGSKDYIQDATDLCGLVDDPDIGIDVDVAVLFDAAITGDPSKIETFLDTLILSGYALDAYTLNHYVTRSLQNPVLFPYVVDLERDFFKRFSFTDCINSPCNYFAPTSNNIGVIGDIANALNYDTAPTLPDLKSIPSGFAMGMASLNKIPLSIQESFGEITELTTNVFKSALNIFNDDPEKVRLQQDAIESGSSYRSTSISDVYTSDYRSYLDVSTAASDILGAVAGKMGNCFKLYQYQHRYNPFDYRMNQQAANKSAILRRIEGVYASIGYNGVSVGSPGQYRTSGTGYTTSPTQTNQATPPLPGTDAQVHSTMSGETIKMWVTAFGGYYEASTKTLWQDSSDTGITFTGINTQAGIGHRGEAWMYTPSNERIAVAKIKEGFKYPANPDPPKTGQFNGGFATDVATLIKYFDIVHPGGSKHVEKAVADGTLKAKIKFNDITRTIPIVDKKSPSRHGEYDVIYITLDLIATAFGLGPTRRGGPKQGTVDADIIDQVQPTGVGMYEQPPSNIAEVQFIIPGIEIPKTKSPYDPDPTFTPELPFVADGELTDQSGGLLPPLPRNIPNNKNAEEYEYEDEYEDEDDFSIE